MGVANGARTAHIPPMPDHRYKVGQTVMAPSGGPYAMIPRGPHVIVRLMPSSAGEPQYRVRSSADGLERVVLESQLRPVEQTLKESDKSEPEPGKPGRR